MTRVAALVIRQRDDGTQALEAPCPHCGLDFSIVFPLDARHFRADPYVDTRARAEVASPRRA